MKVKRVYFIPGGIAQFWLGEEQRRSRLEACAGEDGKPVVEMELLPQSGGYIRLMYGGQGPFYIGPHLISGVLVEEAPAVPPPPATRPEPKAK